MSKSLIRLVDEAILPAFLIIGIKILSIALINDILSLLYYYANFGRLYYPYNADVSKVNTYSDLIVFVCFAIGVAFILIRLLYFTDNKTNPSIILRLAKTKNLNFIRTSIEIYHTLFVWMVYLTGITIYILVRTISVIDNLFILIPVLTIYLVLVWIGVKEIERDIIKKLNFGKHNLV